MAENQPHTVDQLWMIMQEEWEGIDQFTIDRFVDSMPDHVRAVISADGGHTKWQII
ncbi:hypothetical protein L873DRAFT_1736137 [Choiromyces venosus 120613-1]|uniref:Uncharacterized protein n=1 Tax=Choiromyces venosus 120613-1 TaxID=1336337 RepID=A0A3N4JR20_9PEZI|nr:hypothetical protein L873DRAFT_1736137 [Choiromyces venosus 120613-1]